MDNEKPKAKFYDPNASTSDIEAEAPFIQPQPAQVTYMYPVQQTQVVQPFDGQNPNAVAPSVTYVVAPAPPSLVAPYCIPTRHMESFEMKCYACGVTGDTDVRTEKSAL